MVSPARLMSCGAPMRAISSWKMICSISEAPRPPYAFGQCTPHQPAS
jgi:hypothetical protein